MNDFNENLINAVQVRDTLYNMRSRNYKNNAVRIELWHEIAQELNCEVDVCQTRWKSLRRRYCEETHRMRKTPSGSGVSIKKPWPYVEIMNFLSAFVENRPTSSSCGRTILNAPASPLQIETGTETSTESSSHDTEQYFDIHTLSPSQYEIVYSEETNRQSSSRVPNEPQLPKIQKTLATPEANSKPMPKSKLSNKNLQKILEDELLKGSQPQDEVDMFLLSLAPMMRSFDPTTRLRIQIQFHQILLNQLQEN